MAKGKGPGGFSVGKVSIRVVPDVSGFREELEAGLKKELGKFAVKIKVKPDLDGFREKVKAETSGMTAKVHVFADTHGFDKDLDKVIDAKREATVGVTESKASMDLFKKRIGNDIAAFERDIEVKIPLTEAGENFRRRIERDKAFLQDMLALEVPDSAAEAAKYRNAVMGIAKRFRDLTDDSLLDLPVTPKLELDPFQKAALQEVNKLSKDIEAKIPVTPEGEEYRLELRKMVREAEKAIKLRLPVDFDDNLAAKQEIKRIINKIRDSGGETLGTPTSDELKRIAKAKKSMARFNKGIAMGEYRTKVASSLMLNLVNTLGFALALLGPAAVAAVVGGTYAIAGAIGAVGAAVSVIGGAAIAGGFIFAAAKSEQVKKAWEGAKASIKEVMAGVNQPVENSVAGLLDALPESMKAARPAIARTSEAVAELVDHVKGDMPAIIGAAGDAMERSFKAALPMLKATSDNLPNVISGIGDFFQILGNSQNIQTIWTKFLGWLPKGFAKLAHGIDNAGGFFLKMQDWLRSDTLKPFREGLSGFVDFLKNADWTTFKQGVEDLLNSFGHFLESTNFQSALDFIGQIIGGISNITDVLAHMPAWGIIGAFIGGRIAAALGSSLLAYFGTKSAAAIGSTILGKWFGPSVARAAGITAADSFVAGVNSRAEKESKKSKKGSKGDDGKGTKPSGMTFIPWGGSEGKSAVDNSDKTNKNTSKIADNSKRTAKAMGKAVGAIGVVGVATGGVDSFIGGWLGNPDYSTLDSIGSALSRLGTYMRGEIDPQFKETQRNLQNLIPTANQMFDALLQGPEAMAGLHIADGTLDDLRMFGLISDDVYYQFKPLADEISKFKPPEFKDLPLYTQPSNEFEAIKKQQEARQSEDATKVRLGLATKRGFDAINEVINTEAPATADALASPFKYLNQVVDTTNTTVPTRIGEILQTSTATATTNSVPLKTALLTPWQGWSTAATTEGAQVQGSVNSTFSGINGIVGTNMGQATGKVISGFGTMQGSANTTMPNVENSISTAWANANAGTATSMEALVSTVDSKFGEAENRAAQAPPTIESNVNQPGLLAPAGNSIMQSLLDGLKSAWGAVQSFVSGVAGWIADHKGPISYDRVLLTPAGEAIMEGLNTGLNTGFEGVKSNVKGMSDAIVDAFNAGTGAGFNDLKKNVENFQDEIQKVEDKYKKQEDDLDRKYGVGDESEEKKQALDALRKSKEDELNVLRDQQLKAEDAQAAYLDRMANIAEETPAKSSLVNGFNAALASEQAGFEQAGTRLRDALADGFNKNGWQGVFDVAAPLAMNAPDIGARMADGFYDRLDKAFEGQGWLGVGDALKSSLETADFPGVGKTLADSVLGDLGIKGDGVISRLYDNPEYFRQVQTLVFNVNNLDEALEIERRKRREEAAGYGG